MAKQKQELAVIDFTQFSVAQLPELKGKKEEIASIIDANPIVEIVDNATYESAKKSRTAVKTLRTGLEKEQKDVKKKIKEHVLDVVDLEYDILILGVKASEQSRQEPIDVWEEKKEQERQEKARLEQERIDGIKNKINSFFEFQYGKLSVLVFEGIDAFKTDFENAVLKVDIKSFDEFEVLWDSKLADFRGRIIAKIQTLTEQEQIRIDNLLIQEKNAEQSLIQEWQRTWNANIDTLSISDIADIKSVLAKSKLADLKHYVSGYEEIYLSTEKRLYSQIEFVSKAEEQRIAQEKLEQEKKEFEKKQAEAKFQERCKRLTDAGSIYFKEKNGYKKEGHWYHYDDIKRDSDEMFERELEDAKKEGVAEELEVVSEEVLETPLLEETNNEKGNDYPFGNQDEKVFQKLAAEKTDEFANNNIQEVEFEDVSQKSVKPIVEFDLPKEATWDSILLEYEETINSQIEFEESSHYEFKGWLFENYNVPTKKQ